MSFSATLTVVNLCIAVALVVGGAIVGLRDKSRRDRLVNLERWVTELRAERDDCRSRTAEMEGTLKALSSNWVRELARELVEVTAETARVRPPRRRGDPGGEDWRR